MLVVAIKISYGKFSCTQLQTKSPNLSRQKAQSRDFRVGHSSDKIHHSSLLFLIQYPQILPAFRSLQEFAKSSDHSRSRAVEPRLHPNESRFFTHSEFSIVQNHLDQSCGDRRISARNRPFSHSFSPSSLHFLRVLAPHILHQLQLIPNCRVIFPAFPLPQQPRSLQIVQRQQVTIPVRLRCAPFPVPTWMISFRTAS